MFTVNMDVENPYINLIKNVVTESFPDSAEFTETQTLEALTNKIVASGAVRFGPAPSPEGIVYIRKVISESIENNHPIPVLMPWGPHKTSNSNSVDIAELMGLKTIKCLNDRIKRFYKPGINVNIRIEDLCGSWLFPGESGVVASMIEYIKKFRILINILELDFINPIAESDMIRKEQYFEKCEYILPYLTEYISALETDGSDLDVTYNALESRGWKGTIPPEQRQYYYKRYDRLYNDGDNIKRLARYFSSSWARSMCGATGAIPEMDNIQLSFAPPIPGMPKAIADKVVNYRTIHTKYTKRHLPPWRAKGFFKIRNDNLVTPSLVTWNNDLDLLPSSLILSNGDNEVKIDADYMVVD